jgi:growth factor-regulated tyrosine kinase substrate
MPSLVTNLLYHTCFFVEKATSEFMPSGEENLGLQLDISDDIRSKKISAKEAVQAMKKRLGHKNPNVQLATLSVN